MPGTLAATIDLLVMKGHRSWAGVQCGEVTRPDLYRLSLGRTYPRDAVQYVHESCV